MLLSHKQTQTTRQLSCCWGLATLTLLPHHISLLSPRMSSQHPKMWIYKTSLMSCSGLKPSCPLYPPWAKSVQLKASRGTKSRSLTTCLMSQKTSVPILRIFHSLKTYMKAERLGFHISLGLSFGCGCPRVGGQETVHTSHSCQLRESMGMSSGKSSL